MIKHIVILNFKLENGINYLDLLESTRLLVEEMPGVIEYNLYGNESHYTPAGVCSIGVQIDFKDDEALQQFMENPKHYDINATFVKYLADPPFMVLTYHVADRGQG